MVELGRGRAEGDGVDAASGKDRAALVGFRRERRDGVEDAVAIAVIGRGDDAVRGLGEDVGAEGDQARDGAGREPGEDAVLGAARAQPLAGMRLALRL